MRNREIGLHRLNNHSLYCTHRCERSVVVVRLQREPQAAPLYVGKRSRVLWQLEAAEQQNGHRHRVRLTDLSRIAFMSLQQLRRLAPR